MALPAIVIAVAIDYALGGVGAAIVTLILGVAAFPVAFWLNGKLF